MNPPTLLAADFGTFVSVVFLIIAFLGWVMNAISERGGKNPPPGQKQRRQPPARGGGRAQGGRAQGVRGQSEVDRFLQEVTGRDNRQNKRQGGARRPAASPKPERAPARVIEFEEDDSPRSSRSRVAELERESERSRGDQDDLERLRGRRRRNRQQAEEEQRRLQRMQRDYQASEEAERQERLRKKAERRATGDAVAAASSAPRPANAGTVALLASLRDPVEIRRAIVINEILSPPVTRRK